MPGPRAIIRHALPNVLVGKIVPVVLFLAFLRWAGTPVALAVALAWSVAVIVQRIATRQHVPGLVLVSLVGLVGRTVLALATGSLIAYFLQPTISTALVGVAFAVSVVSGRPLAARLAKDFCPFDPETADHPMLALFFGRLSVLWAVTSLVNAGLTLWLLLTQSVTTFVVIKSFMGPLFTTATLGLATLWFRVHLRRAGFRLEFGAPLGAATA